MTENQIAKEVFESALIVHKIIGPGLLESAYQASLTHLLKKKGLYVECQKPLKLVFEEIELDQVYKIDIMVEGKFIIEIKSIDAIHEIHMAQIITYLKLADCKLGMLINFNVPLLKQGVKRVINGYL